MKPASGFTLIEILMVLILVSILGAVATSRFISFSQDAKTAMTNEKLAVLKMSIVGDARRIANGKPTHLGYEKHCSALPVTLASLIAIPGAGVCASVYSPFTKKGWRGPYVSSTDANYDKDAWGTTIVYSSGARTLTSWGPNKASGGGDDITVSF